MKGFSPGPGRDRQLLQILRAGHRSDIEAYMHVHRPDLIDRHETAMAIISEYQAAQKVAEKLCTWCILCFRVRMPQLNFFF